MELIVCTYPVLNIKHSRFLIPQIPLLSNVFLPKVTDHVILIFSERVRHKKITCGQDIRSILAYFEFHLSA